jgi:hypothetical protein
MFSFDHEMLVVLRGGGRLGEGGQSLAPPRASFVNATVADAPFHHFSLLTSGSESRSSLVRAFTDSDRIDTPTLSGLASWRTSPPSWIPYGTTSIGMHIRRAPIQPQDHGHVTEYRLTER